MPGEKNNKIDVDVFDEQAGTKDGKLLIGVNKAEQHDNFITRDRNYARNVVVKVRQEKENILKSGVPVITFARFCAIMQVFSFSCPVETKVKCAILSSLLQNIRR